MGSIEVGKTADLLVISRPYPPAWPDLPTSPYRSLIDATEGRPFMTVAQVRTAGTLGDRPLVVLAAGLPLRDQRSTAVEAHRRIWLGERQAALARLSGRGRLVVAENSAHKIPFERPDAVVDAVRTIVNETRE